MAKEEIKDKGSETPAASATATIEKTDIAKTPPVDKNAVDEQGVPLVLKEVMAKKRQKDKESREAEKKERAKKTAKEPNDIKVEEPEKTEPSVPAGETETKEQYEEVEIDPRLVAAGRAKGWSNERIIKQAEEDESVLVDLADALDILSAQHKPPEPPAPKKEESKKLSKVELDAEAVKSLSDNYGEDVVSKVISPLAERLNEAIDTINTLRGGVEQFSEGQKKEMEIRRINTANEIFDKAAETYPVIGKTENLPKLANGRYDERNPAVTERDKIWRKAQMFFREDGGSFEDAMDNALRWYGGGNVDSLKRKVIADLDREAKKHLARPTAKKTEPSYETREEEGTAIVKEARERSRK